MIDRYKTLLNQIFQCFSVLQVSKETAAATSN